MKCLHICNDFSFTKVHKNLYTHLDELGLKQIIYNPIKQNTPVGANNILFKSVDSRIIYSKLLKKYHRIFFRKKIKFLFNDLESKCDLSKIKIIHATTLFSDGALALRIYTKYKIPYIVAVRGTDISTYLRYRPDLIFLLADILNNARRIIFLSEAIKRQFLRNPLLKLIDVNLDNKSLIICNGIDKYWLTKTKPKSDLKPFKILYIGRFDRNKNTPNLIRAVQKLKYEYPDLQLDLVGAGGQYENFVTNFSSLNKDFVQNHGPIYDKDALLKIYRSNHIFAMPSHGETFGLVYIEALSQGLPIICSKNQGIDGTFKHKVGEFVNPKSIDSIALAIKNIIDNYHQYQIDKISFEKFQWKYVSSYYLGLYKKMI